MYQHRSISIHKYLKYFSCCCASTVYFLYFLPSFAMKGSSQDEILTFIASRADHWKDVSHPTAAEIWYIGTNQCGFLGPGWGVKVTTAKQASTTENVTSPLGWECLLFNKSQLSQGREIRRYRVKESMPICLSTAHWKVLEYFFPNVSSRNALLQWRRAFRLETFGRKYFKTFQCAVLRQMGIDLVTQNFTLGFHLTISLSSKLWLMVTFEPRPGNGWFQTETSKAMITECPHSCLAWLKTGRVSNLGGCCCVADAYFTKQNSHFLTLRCLSQSLENIVWAVTN